MSALHLEWPLEPVEVAVLVGAMLGLYILALSLGRWLKRHRRVRLGFLYQLLCIVSALYLPLQTTGLNFGNGVIDAQRELLALLIPLLAVFLIAVLDRFLWDRFRENQQLDTGVPKFLRDVLAIVLLCAAFLVVVAFVYGKTAPGLLAGSGILAIILGFALQDLLGNVFSGIALEIGRPFRPGDWLQIGDQFGRVIDINWRSVRVITNDQITLDIPNNQIARNTITNLTYPSPRHAMRIAVGIEYGAAPNVVKEVFLQATKNVPGVLVDPPPRVFLIDFGDSSITYEIKFFMADHALYPAACDGIRTNLWYALKRAGIKIPFPIRTLQIERARKLDDATARALEILRQFPLLGDLRDEQLQFLIEAASHDSYGRRETMIEQGEAGESMYLLLNGSAEVHVRGPTGLSTFVATLRTGDCFGEMSLLTGEPRAASVVAASDCEVLEIGKSAMSRVLREQPGLAQSLGELLAQRQIENEAKQNAVLATEEAAVRQRTYAAKFLGKLTDYFGL